MSSPSSTTHSQSPIHNDEDERDKSLPLWSKSNFNEKYVQVQISNICGTGAFSKVYLGSNIVTSAQVAVKVIDRTVLCDEEEKRLVAEIGFLRELSHDNILGELHCPLRSVLYASASPANDNSINSESFSLLFCFTLMNSYPRCLPRDRELSHYSGVHEWWRSS